MTTKSGGKGKKRANVTARDSTHNTPFRTTESTPIDSTLITPPKSTQRAYKPRARKCACGCGEVFTPLTRHGKYATDACRKRAYARRKTKERQAVPTPAPALEVAHCQHCGTPFWATPDSGQAYCKPSHRTAAWRYRRSATIRIIAKLDNCTLAAADAQIKALGLKVIAEYLRLKGYGYDTERRRWRELKRSKIVPFDTLAG